MLNKSGKENKNTYIDDFFNFNVHTECKHRV